MRKCYQSFKRLLTGHTFEQGECLILVLLHDFTLSRTLVVDSAEVQDAVDDDAMELIIVGLAKLLGIGADRIQRNHDVAVNHIFLAVVLQFHVLCIEIEGGIGVVIQVHVHLIAHLSVDVEIDFLIKIHHRRLSVADRQRRIVDALLVDTELKFGRTLSLHSDATRTEDFLGRSQVEVHI
mgnify:CR=1 FL=1